MFMNKKFANLESFESIFDNKVFVMLLHSHALPTRSDFFNHYKINHKFHEVNFDYFL